jgi:hypothetical protein
MLGGNGHSRGIRWAFTPKITGYPRGTVQLPSWLTGETVASDSMAPLIQKPTEPPKAQLIRVLGVSPRATNSVRRPVD